MQKQLPSAPRQLGEVETESELWARFRGTGDLQAKTALLEIHLPYARVVAATYYSRRTTDDVEFGDYLQLARIGLLESVDRYDPSHGAQFRTFASRRMHGSILNGLEISTEKGQQIAARKRIQQDRLLGAKEAAKARKRTGRGQREDLLDYLADIGIGLAIGVLLEGSGMIDGDSFSHAPQPSAESSYFQKTEVVRLQQLVLNALNHLTEQEQIVVRRHYLQEHPFEQIASHLGLSKGRISQIHKSALSRLRECLNQRDELDIQL